VAPQKAPDSFFGPNRFDLTPFKALNTFDNESPTAAPKIPSSEPFPFHEKSQLSTAAPVFCPANQQTSSTVAPLTARNTVGKAVGNAVQTPCLELVVALKPNSVAIKPDPGTPIKAEIC
jgi:hypothetical protein